jgi:cellulose biosynthesis protein BcsQ
VVTVRIERVQEVLDQARAKACDLAIIDTAAAQVNALSRILELSDLCVIPSQPTAPDIWGSRPTARDRRSADSRSDREKWQWLGRSNGHEFRGH